MSSLSVATCLGVMIIIVVLVTKLCLTLCHPMDCSPPGSSGISQARILEQVAISFSRGSFRPRDQTHVSCTGRSFFTTEPAGEPYDHYTLCYWPIFEICIWDMYFWDMYFLRYDLWDMYSKRKHLYQLFLPLSFLDCLFENNGSHLPKSSRKIFFVV